MKAVILAGGLGTRISEESHLKPKPMIEIGGKPILWHIMKQYSAHGIHDFVICLGYKGYAIKDFFANYFLHTSDVTFDMRANRMDVHQNYSEPWRVTLVDTGEETMTGGRLRRAARYLEGEEAFCFTYGDGVSDLDIGQLVAFHRAHGKHATVTAVQPPGRYGALQCEGDRVLGFSEKPRGDGGWINGGFFVLSPAVLPYIDGDATSWEAEPITQLAQEGQLQAFTHEGFWHPMDTLRDKNYLEQLWANGEAPMETVDLNPGFWAGKRVLVTGHTGFKGSWLVLWLRQMGAEVIGFAQDPSTEPNLFTLARVGEGIDDRRGDVRDLGAVMNVLLEAQPQIVLHLAAQPLVREGYRDPLGTYSTNVMGTLNLLEAIRQIGGVRACVVVTTDKVYANQEWPWPYRENEALGGHDPYSSSKACCELLVQSYKSSFFPAAEHAAHGLCLATARAGNVVGGGDFSPERLIPDVLKAWTEGRPVTLRYPQAVRPWQHVLEPLAGYLHLAQALYERGPAFEGAWNFGPGEDDARSVGEVVQLLASQWPQAAGVELRQSELHEAGLLRLDSSRARQALGWQPRWSLSECLDHTLAWHQGWQQGLDMRAVCLTQLHHYKESL